MINKQKTKDACLCNCVELNTHTQCHYKNIFYIFRNQDSEVEGDSNGDLQIASPGNSEAQQALAHFWPKVMEEIKNITTVSKTIVIQIK